MGGFAALLEKRCVPCARSGLREYLDAIGVTEYDLLKIICKTKDCVAEDAQWIESEEMA